MPSKFAIDALPANGLAGVSKAQNDNLDTLVLDAGKEWSRPLRGSGRELTFASFQVYGSQTTIIEIGGARLGLKAGPIPGSLQLMFDNSAAGTLQLKSLNVHVSAGKYAGKSFSALPTLTVVLDPGAECWHLYSGSRLLADHLPLISAERDNRQFTVKAGTEGAWVIGLVLADKNPLYVDANVNGIDDVFERQKLGALLPAGAAITTRRQLAQDWKAAQRVKAPPALFVNRPLPDRLVVADSIAPRK
ncbi:MAG: hypothetical protein EXS40_06575 [Opitutaceae bacterium]|nr:hypothetical protein [Opitutaceae bacterium]